MDDIKQALEAYNSPLRHNFNLDGQTVSNLDAVLHYLTNALSSATADETVNILMTMANMVSFQGKIDEAINGYEQALQTANQWQQISLHTYLAIWRHYQADSERVNSHIDALSQLSPSAAKTVSAVITIIESNLKTPITYDQNGSNSAQQRDAKHAIVTLGYKLNGDGSIAPPLELRLEKTLEIATLNPDSIIIVTGGVETAGITEAEQMERWLLKRGINGRRIIKEDEAINTIENAQRSLGILQAQEIRKTTLVSASIHVHRSQILFETVLYRSRQSSHSNSVTTMTFDHIAVEDGLSPDAIPTGQTRINCYIDALRGAGLKAFQCGHFTQI